MAKFIEFVGVSGVGKSTTFEFLRKKWKKNSTWTLYDNNFLNNRLGRWEIIKRSLKGIIGPHRVSGNCHNWNLLNRFFEKNPDLLEIFWRELQENYSRDGKDLRFHSVHYILKILEKIQDVQEEASSMQFLLDEGLIHNLNYFLPSTTDISYETKLSRVFDLINLPVAVVYFEADIDTVVQRTLSRSKQNPRDSELSPVELAEARFKSLKEKQKFTKMIQLRNVPVLYLKSSEAVPEKADKIIAFINSLDSVKNKKKVQMIK